MSKYIATLALATALILPATGFAQEYLVSANDPTFVQRANVSEREAAGIALSVQPSSIIGVNYEIEANGTPIYGFTIQTQNGQAEVEVNAATGGIVRH